MSDLDLEEGVPNADEESSENAGLLARKRDSNPGAADRVDSAATAHNVQLHGLAGAESQHSGAFTPVDCQSEEDLQAKMATVVAARFSSNDDSPNGDVDGDGGGRPNTLFDESQAGVIEMASMIADPNLKRAESTDMLHLNLHQLCRDGDIDSLKKFLQYMTGNVRKKINHHDDEDLSPLHYAARYNHVPVVQALVEYGANVNDVDEEGASPLHFAARYKRMRLSSLASPTEGQKPEEGDDENKDEDDNGAEFPQESTPENSVIMYLESKGGDVNAGDTYGCTPLHFAAMRGNEVATKELLSCKGINIEAVDKQQMTALHLAASHNEVEVVRMLIEKGANLRCCDEDMGTPLHFACMEGSMEVVRMLFEAGEKHDGWVTVSQMVTDQDNQQNTSLHLAVENRSLDVAKLCIEKGANVNTPRTNYQTPLHLAAMAGEKSISELLIEHGARVDALDINQETPLYKAAAYDHSDVVEYLLEKGARINRHDKDNFSPLLIAACNGHAKTIRTLLEMGANLYDMDKNDKTCMFWCAEEDNDEALQTILEHPKSKELLDWSDRYDNTPLHIAAQKGYLNCVKILLDHSAGISRKNEEESSPLHLAASNGRTG